MEEKKTNSVVFGGNIEWHTTGKPNKGFNDYLVIKEYTCKKLNGYRFITHEIAASWFKEQGVKCDKWGFMKRRDSKIIAWAEIPAETIDKLNITQF